MSSSGDSEVFNTLERAVSGDLNDLQAIAQRNVANILGYYGQSARVVGVPSDTVRNVVFGGLIASPSGVNVSISPGALGQNTNTLAPVPGPLDSTYRFARNDVATVVAMPAPGVTTYYLIEAQMVEVVTSSQLRDIYNPTLNVFAPALVTKQIQHHVQFQVVAGNANAPAPSGGNWVPIAIVKRPPGGPAVSADDIIDVRPVAEWGRERPSTPVLSKDRQQTAAGAGITNNILLDVQADGGFGKRAFGVVLGTIDPSTAVYLSPTTALAASTRYYLYLAPWSALSLNPRQLNLAGTIAYEGVLVLSDVAPTTSGRNSAPVALPPPFGVVPAPTSSAYYIGTLFRDSGNAGFYPFERVNGRQRYWYSAWSNYKTSYAPPAGSQALTIAAAPARARKLVIHYFWNGGAAAGNVGAQMVEMFVVDPVSGTQLNSVWVQDNGHYEGEIEVPYEGQATLTIATAGGINAGTVLTIASIAFEE